MWRKQTAQGVLWINDSRIHENMKVAGDDSAVKLACCKLFVDSKSGRCNFWDFLLCDDRRSRWWASRDGPQHDRSRSDTVMISMPFNSYASLAIFFISFLLFSAFFFEHEPIYAIRVLTEFDFYYRTSACNLIERENLQYSDRPFRFVFGFSSLLML